MKRRPSFPSSYPSKFPAIPGASRANSNVGTPPVINTSGPNILDPLLQAKLLRLSEEYKPKIVPSLPTRNYEQVIKGDDRYQTFDKLKQDLLSETNGDKKVELTNFIIDNLAKKNIPNSSGSLDYVQLLNKPYMQKGAKMDFYSGSLGPKEKNSGIVMSPYKSDLNPITTLMHEGTHALDDFVMKTYQKEAIDTLAKQEAAGEIGPGFDKLKQLYEESRDILGNKEFSKYYNFDEIAPNLTGAFKDLTELEDKPGTPKVTDFQGAQTALNSINTRNQEPPPHLFLDFSEFPTFSMEQLFEPWDINPQTNPQSKEFLNNIMKGVSRNFKQLGLQNPAYKAFKYTNPADPTTYKTSKTPAYIDMQQKDMPGLEKLRSNYPDVYQAFKDRKAQFKNPLVKQLTPPPTPPLISPITPSNTPPGSPPGTPPASSSMVPRLGPFNSQTTTTTPTLGP